MYKELIDRLEQQNTLSFEEYLALIEHREEIRDYAAERAFAVRQRYYGSAVFIRGLIELSSYRKNDCYYCGLRASNKNAQRYRLTAEQILSCAQSGYALGFRTFVLQGGEDGYYTDALLCGVITELKARFPDCAVTLSLGERSTKSYRALKEAGADRYLLRHETANEAHYNRLHPKEMSFENRMRCVRDLKALGYQLGIGFMVGSPFQTDGDLANELLFLKELQPQMVGIGPFVSHKDTPFKDFPSGDVKLTLRLLSVLRLMFPYVLLPATTALGTAAGDGREQGLKHGANVIMPHLFPVEHRKQYSLYDNKICTGEESAICRNCLELRVKSAGYQIVNTKGDVIRS